MKKNDDYTTVSREYKDIREDYRPAEEPDIFVPATKADKTKHIIFDRLNQVDRTIILLYAELRSYRALGRRLHLSQTVVSHEVRRIRTRILEEYEKIKDNETIC